MKTLKYILGALAAVLVVTSCDSFLRVTPIDPNSNTAEKALVEEANFTQLLAGIYTGFATSGYYGANGGPSISGLDGGASQYLRGLVNLNELTTDEMVCGWNDQTIKDLHWMIWTTSDVFIYAFYSRIFMQVALANEFIRQANNSTLDFSNKAEYIAEARVLRAIAYYHAIDNFGNVPFADDKTVVSFPEQIKRADLFTWLEGELKDLIDNSALAEPRANGYARADKGVAKFLLAKLYLNAEVYTGTKMYDKCAEVLKDLMDDGYALHTTSAGKYSAYQELFLADNEKCKEEIIFAVEQDGVNTTSYGATNYLIFASTGGSMNAGESGISSGWAGLRTTPQFVDKFTSGDQRNLLYNEVKSQADINSMPTTPEEARAQNPKKYDDDKWATLDKSSKKFDQEAYDNECKSLAQTKNDAVCQQKDIEDIGNFAHGYGFQKFLNRTSKGDYGKEAGFVDTDFPMMRYADVLLMAAECQMRGASIDGAAAMNAVRSRAGLGSLELNEKNILDERGRELYMECWRRSDLIRFGKFTSGYNWQWKGNVKDGKNVEAWRALFPIPESDKLANSNLSQNEGY